MATAFAPLALAVHATGSGTGVTAAHYLIGIFGLPIPPRIAGTPAV